MKKNIKFLTVIPARSGSKGIPNKNIRPFCGKPLIAYAIIEAKKSKYLDSIIVSTDSPKYAAIAKKYGAEVPFLRPPELAADKSLIIDTIIDLLDRLKRDEKYVPNYLVLLQTTSPLRTVKDIDNCIELALNKKCDAVMSMCSTDNLLYTIEGDYLKLLYNKDWVLKTNRQSVPPTFKINGPAVLITKVSAIYRDHSFIRGTIVPYVMKKMDSVDLDSEEDFQLAELIYSAKLKSHIK